MALRLAATACNDHDPGGHSLCHLIPHRLPRSLVTEHPATTVPEDPRGRSHKNLILPLASQSRKLHSRRLHSSVFFASARRMRSHAVSFVLHLSIWPISQRVAPRPCTNCDHCYIWCFFWCRVYQRRCFLWRLWFFCSPASGIWW